MMSERDGDVAYVLEGIPGVRGAYAVRGHERIRYAIHFEPNGYAIAQAHYALLRVFTHEECAAVAVFQLELPASILAKATRLALTAGARASACAQVPLTTPALEQALAVGKANPTPTPTSNLRRVLIVTDDRNVQLAAIEAFGSNVHRFVIADPFAALWEAKAHRFDLLVCDVDRAFGLRGFVSNLEIDHPVRAERVLLLMPPRGQPQPEPDARFLKSEILRKPVTPADFRNVTERAVRRRPHSISIQTLIGEAMRNAGPARRVLLIDERASAVDAPHLELTVARNAWEALERIHEDWALVVCSLTMKTDTGARLYALLWKARPEIKQRFALLVDDRDDSNRVLTRPLTAAAVMDALARLPT